MSDYQCNGFSTYCTVGQGSVYFPCLDSHIFSPLSLPLVAANLLPGWMRQGAVAARRKASSVLVIFGRCAVVNLSLVLNSLYFIINQDSYVCSLLGFGLQVLSTVKGRQKFWRSAWNLWSAAVQCSRRIDVGPQRWCYLSWEESLVIVYHFRLF